MRWQFKACRCGWQDVSAGGSGRRRLLLVKRGGRMGLLGREGGVVVVVVRSCLPRVIMADINIHVMAMCSMGYLCLCRPFLSYVLSVFFPFPE